MRMKFSTFEIREIVKAWLAVSLIFGIAFAGPSAKLFVALPIMLLTAGIGFLLHELAHKYVAQRYGCWAEFRANNQALVFGILISFTGFVLAAPGGVFIHGATAKQHGRIAYAGPMMNLILAAAFYGLSMLTAAPILAELMKYGFKINALLGAFNLIPFPPFDGFSVWRWNKLAYFLGIGGAAILLML